MINLNNLLNYPEQLPSFSLRYIAEQTSQNPRFIESLLFLQNIELVLEYNPDTDGPILAEYLQRNRLDPKILEEVCITIKHIIPVAVHPQTGKIVTHVLVDLRGEGQAYGTLAYIYPTTTQMFKIQAKLCKKPTTENQGVTRLIPS